MCIILCVICLFCSPHSQKWTNLTSLESFPNLRITFFTAYSFFPIANTLKWMTCTAQSFKQTHREQNFFKSLNTFSFCISKCPFLNALNTVLCITHNNLTLSHMFAISKHYHGSELIGRLHVHDKKHDKNYKTIKNCFSCHFFFL